MKEIKGNLWDYHRKHWICITTNGFVKNNNEAVMGAGTAKQAAQRHPSLPLQLGIMLRENGNHVHSFYEKRIFSFPVKRNWWEKAELYLIRRSCIELVKAVDYERLQDVYMPRPGCGNGGLTWDVVKPILEETLDGRFNVVSLEE